MKNYLLVCRWSPTDVRVINTEGKLRTFFRSFAPPSITALGIVLERVSRSRIEKKITVLLEKIKQDCITCQRNATAPRMFKLIVETVEIRFDHKMREDTLFINARPVIHIVDEGTYFCAAQFLCNQTSKEIRARVQHMCSLVYLGRPDYLVVDEGASYTSRKLEESLKAYGVKLEEAPIETPRAI